MRDRFLQICSLHLVHKPQDLIFFFSFLREHSNTLKVSVLRFLIGND